MTTPRICAATPEHDPAYVRDGRCTICSPAAPAATVTAQRPPDPFPWYEEPRSGKSTGAAVLLFITGGLAVLGAVALLAAGELPGVMVFILLWGGFEIWIGVALLLRQRWATTAGRVVGIIGVLLSGYSLLAGNVFTIIGLGIYIAIVSLLFADTSRD